MCGSRNFNKFCTVFSLVVALSFAEGTLLNFKTSSNTQESIKIFSNNSAKAVGPGEALFLTPYIQAGRIQEAKALAAVQDLGEIKSYSGFFTVNPEYNSNIYFWFFPAAYNPEEAPVVVWLQGGPGGSSLFGLFTEHGPFFVDENKNLNLRSTAWTLTHSVVYIDNPVGTGFSFTDHENGYARNQSDVARDLYSALEQFFTLFPELKARDFYVTGESYAGKYVPALSFKIHTENKNSPKIRMNLKGLLVIDGLTDPVSMMYYGDYLYNLGLLDHHQKAYFEKEEKKIRNLIKKEEWLDAYEVFKTLIASPGCYFENITGLTFHYNILIASNPPESDYFHDFLQLNNVRRALHVGNSSFSDMGKVVIKYLREDVPQSVKPWLEALLDAKESYKILFCSGQLDIIVANTLTDNMLRHLQWSGAQDFAVAKRKIWRKGKNVVGYVKTARNFTHLLIRNAGHMVPTDQPKYAFDLITKFTDGTPFAEGVNEFVQAAA